MSNFIQNFGLEFLTKTEEDVAKLMRLIAQEGMPVAGYSGSFYLNYHFGEAQFIARALLEEQKKHVSVIGLDTHCRGDCIWTCRLSEITIQAKDADPLERRCILTSLEDGSGMVPVNIVNADVLPSYLKDDEITLQMIGFPVSIDYFADEEAYAASVPEERSGKKYLLADGMIFPTGFMHNHDVDRSEEERNDAWDDHVLLRGTVKHIYWGKLQFGDNEPSYAFLKAIVQTSYGDLQLVHLVDDVNEKLRTNMKPGATVVSLCVLSGDPAIDAYEKGAIYDEEHDLRLLRYIIVKGSAARGKFAFEQDCVYHSKTGSDYRGRDEIISRFQYSYDNSDVTYHAHMATISPQSDKTLEYAAGKRCLVLAAGEETNYRSILFIDVNEKGRITRLLTTDDSRYHFRLDEKPKRKNPFADLKIPDSVLEPIAMRAKFLGLIDETEEIAEQSDRYGDFESNARQMLLALEERPQLDRKMALTNMFGYLLAKQLEIYRCENKQFWQRPRAVSYIPADVFSDNIIAFLPKKELKIVREAMDLGKLFYKDFQFFVGHADPVSDKYREELLRSLIAVQRIGELYAPKAMKAIGIDRG